MDSRKQELQKLKEEENTLEKEFDSSMKEKEKISVQLQDTQIQISQVRAMVTQLEEIQRQMKDALVVCRAAVEENNASLVTEYSLNIEPEFRDFKKASLSPEEKAKDGELRDFPKNLQTFIVLLLAFNDSQSATNDPFKPSRPAVAFDESFENKTTGFGDDDSWHGNSWNKQANDPFGASNKPDPFAASHDATVKDVSFAFSL